MRPRSTTRACDDLRVVPWQYVVATTKFINGDQLMEGLLEKVDGLQMDRSNWDPASAEGEDR